MNRHRTWAEPVELTQAERHFQRFVRSTAKRRFSNGTSGYEANGSSPSLGDARRCDEATAMIVEDVGETVPEDT